MGKYSYAGSAQCRGKIKRLSTKKVREILLAVMLMALASCAGNQEPELSAEENIRVVAVQTIQIVDRFFDDEITIEEASDLINTFGTPRGGPDSTSADISILNDTLYLWAVMGRVHQDDMPENRAALLEVRNELADWSTIRAALR